MNHQKLILIAVTACAALFAFSPNAKALAFDDANVVGTISPATPANAANVADYINFMIALAPGDSGTFNNPPHSQSITRSNNLFGSLPAASATGALSGGGTSINLGTGGFTYLFAKYDGQNDLSVVWNVADLTGIVTIPALGPLGHGLSGWILFGGGNGSVPDGGTT